MEKKKSSHHVMVILSDSGTTWITEQAAVIDTNAIGRVGKSGVLRGLVDGLAGAGLDLSECVSSERISAKIKAALTTKKRKGGTK